MCWTTWTTHCQEKFVQENIFEKKKNRKLFVSTARPLYNYEFITSNLNFFILNYKVASEDVYSPVNKYLIFDKKSINNLIVIARIQIVLLKRILFVKQTRFPLEIRSQWITGEKFYQIIFPNSLGSIYLLYFNYSKSLPCVVPLQNMQPGKVIDIHGQILPYTDR